MSSVATPEAAAADTALRLFRQGRIHAAHGIVEALHAMRRAVAREALQRIAREAPGSAAALCLAEDRLRGAPPAEALEAAEAALAASYAAGPPAPSLAAHGRLLEALVIALCNEASGPPEERARRAERGANLPARLRALARRDRQVLGPRPWNLLARGLAFAAANRHQAALTAFGGLAALLHAADPAARLWQHSSLGAPSATVAAQAAALRVLRDDTAGVGEGAAGAPAGLLGEEVLTPAHEGRGAVIWTVADSAYADRFLATSLISLQLAPALLHLHLVLSDAAEVPALRLRVAEAVARAEAAHDRTAQARPAAARPFGALRLTVSFDKLRAASPVGLAGLRFQALPEIQARYPGREIFVTDLDAVVVRSPEVAASWVQEADIAAPITFLERMPHKHAYPWRGVSAGQIILSPGPGGLRMGRAIAAAIGTDLPAAMARRGWWTDQAALYAALLAARATPGIRIANLARQGRTAIAVPRLGETKDAFRDRMAAEFGPG